MKSWMSVEMSAPDVPTINPLPVALPNSLQYFWSTPYDGGSPLSTYTLTVNPGPLVYYPSPSATNTTITGLTNGTTYTATLKSANANGFSQEAIFTSSQPGNLPNGPSSVRAYPSGPNAALVVWTPPTVAPDATIYWYSIQTESSNPADPVLTFSADGLTQTSYLIPGLNPNSSYYFKVSAVNNPGYSPPIYSNPVSFNQNAGNVQWATRQNGAINTNITPGGGGSAVDKDGNVYISGFFNSSTVRFFNYTSAPTTAGGEIRVTVAATYTLGGFGRDNSYIAKYNASGILQWASVIQATSNNGNDNSSVEVDSDNNVYILGRVGNQDTYTFNNFAGILGGVLQLTRYGTFRSSSAADMYLVKYNSSGQIQWFTTVSGTNAESFQAKARPITIDTLGNIYVFLSSGNASIFSAGSVIAGVITPVLYGNMSGASRLLVKWNSAGQAQWATIVISSAGAIYSIASDRGNNVYISGTVGANTLSFCEQLGVSTIFISTTVAGYFDPATSGDGWFAKYDTNGKFKGSCRTNNGSLNPAYLTINPMNEIYSGAWTGGTRARYFSFVSTLDTKLISTTMWGEYVRVSTTTTTDSVVIKFNTDLQFQAISGFYSLTGSITDVTGIVTDSYGNVYHSGFYNGPSTFLRTYISGGGGSDALSTLTFSTIGLLSNTGFANFTHIVKYDRNLQYQWLNYTQANNGSPFAVTCATSNIAMYVDRYNNLYTTGLWRPSAQPLFMYFTNPAGITPDRTISTSTYGYLSTFTAAGGTAYSNAYLVKYS